MSTCSLSCSLIDWFRLGPSQSLSPCSSVYQNQVLTSAFQFSLHRGWHNIPHYKYKLVSAQQALSMYTPSLVPRPSEEEGLGTRLVHTLHVYGPCCWLHVYMCGLPAPRQFRIGYNIITGGQRYNYQLWLPPIYITGFSSIVLHISWDIP